MKIYDRVRITEDDSEQKVIADMVGTIMEFAQADDGDVAAVVELDEPVDSDDPTVIIPATKLKVIQAA